MSKVLYAMIWDVDNKRMEQAVDKDYTMLDSVNAITIK